MNFLRKLLVSLGLVTALSSSAQSADDIASQAAGCAELAVKGAKDIEGFILDYSPQSLEKVDFIILKLAEKTQNPEKMHNTLLVFGCYVGEVMVRNNDAKWTYPPKQFQDAGLDVMGVTSKNGIFWNPIGKVQKLLMNGAEDSLVYFYQVFQEKTLTHPSSGTR